MDSILEMLRNGVSVAPQGSSSTQQGSGGVGIVDDQGGDPNRPGTKAVLNNRSDSRTLKNFLRECHVGTPVIDAIPESLSVGMFVSLLREDINDLSPDVGIQILLRTSQALVKNELATQSTVQPPLELPGDPRGIVAVGPLRQPGEGSQELPSAGQDNVDPYLVSQSVNTPSGRDVIYNLYGHHEGGEATKMARLPSTSKGSYAPKGLHALTIPDLGVNLVSNTAEQRALRVLYWHSYLMIGHHQHY
jgi:hypothetical protein